MRTFGSLPRPAGFSTFNPCLNAVRFINMAEGVASLNIGIQDATVELASGLQFGQHSEFIEIDATLDNVSYTFTFKNQSDSILSTFRLDQYRFRFGRIFPLVLNRNLSFALVGKADNDEENNTLSVVRINNY